MRYSTFHYLFFLCLALGATRAQAHEGRSGGRLLLTNGISTVEGTAGGGLASWAIIAGQETRDGVGVQAHVTELALPKFDLRTVGAAVGFFDRVEVSYAHERFDTHSTGAVLGLGRGFVFSQDIVGAKVKLVGDAVWDQDRWLPQIAIGIQHKIAAQPAILKAVGARRRADTDFYVAATKLILSQGLLINATARLTRANQLGLLGFGGDRTDTRSAQTEVSAGKLLAPNVIVGAEYRTRPDNLRFAHENDAVDLFAAWSPQRNATLTLAFVDLGSIATIKRQHGAMLSLQASF